MMCDLASSVGTVNSMGRHIYRHIGAAQAAFPTVSSTLVAPGDLVTSDVEVDHPHLVLVEDSPTDVDVSASDFPAMTDQVDTISTED